MVYEYWVEMLENGDRWVEITFRTVSEDDTRKRYDSFRTAFPFTRFRARRRQIHLAETLDWS